MKKLIAVIAAVLSSIGIGLAIPDTVSAQPQQCWPYYNASHHYRTAGGIQCYSGTGYYRARGFCSKNDSSMTGYYVYGSTRRAGDGYASKVSCTRYVGYHLHSLGWQAVI